MRSYVQTRKNGDKSIDLMISGAHCAGCMAKIERETSALPGVKSARMNLSTMRLSVDWRGHEKLAGDIVARLKAVGYGAKPFNMELEPTEQKDELKGLLMAMGVAGFAMMNIMLLSVSVWFGVEMGENTRHIMHLISGAIALPAVAYSGRPFFRSALSALKNKTTNMDVPISLAVILACTLSVYETLHNNQDTYFDAAVMLLFLLLIGRYLDTRLRLKTGESAQRLAAMQASTANRIDTDGTIHEIAAHKIKPGDTLLIAAGERVPVDVEIIDGRSDIDTSIATGETLPRGSKPGDKLYSGMINLSAPLRVKALAVSGDSFLSEISKLVEAGEQKKGRFVRIADRAARAYVPVVHSLAALTFIGWILAGGDLRTASLNAIAVLIITCPCALGLAVPAVQVVASGRLFKKGVLIKSGDALERLAKVDTVVFDKTGTLTLGRLELTNSDEIDQYMLELAAKLARGSRHPAARAIAAKAGKGAVATDIEEIPGQGLQTVIDGQTVKLGSAKFVGVKT
ncbi:MAG TPA: heavy metal translocating P-type ATPase, partial [Hellea balneolensis]|nr:heavy metal translocating P-type ATPase [Hellea balneolensis]